MTTLITGVAGFIGMHVAEKLLRGGETVVGVDNLNDYYSISLKKARLDRLREFPAFQFIETDIADWETFRSGLSALSFNRIIHLAAQAGVRYSLENPHAYVATNVSGHLNVLELARRQDGLDHLVYASSSSVYGSSTEAPFKETARVDAPVSLYAATKKADELMSHAYSHLYDIPSTGLRFFTVYGPWGRPDMAYWLFTEAILKGQPIKVFNHGDLWRDFTYVDDIVDGVLAVLEKPPLTNKNGQRLALYNIGNNQPENLLHFIEVLESALGQKAEKQFLPMQAGDVLSTCADTSALHEATGFTPRTKLEDGLPQFVEWYRRFHKI